MVCPASDTSTDPLQMGTAAGMVQEGCAGWTRGAPVCRLTRDELKFGGRAALHFLAVKGWQCFRAVCAHTPSLAPKRSQWS